MKDFDINLAKQGHPVCTRDGRKARIICFDANCENPIIALVEKDDGTEGLRTYLSDGSFCHVEKDKADLMMAPVKHEGWVNVFDYKGDYTTSECIFDTKEEAQEVEEGYIATAKIEWEE